MNSNAQRAYEHVTTLIRSQPVPLRDMLTEDDGRFWAEMAKYHHLNGQWQEAQAAAAISIAVTAAQ
jgi:hypothetical protein